MTLIVYADNKFYADDLSLVDHKSTAVHIRRGVDKTRVSKNEFAVAVCGPFPHEKDRIAVGVGLRKLAFYSDQGSRDVFNKAFSTDEEWDRFLKVSNCGVTTTYIFATTRGLYKLEKNGLSVLNRKNEYAYGSGATYYGICRKMGLTVEQSYAKVAEYERTVGKLFRVIDLSTMDDMVDGIIAQMRSSKDKVSIETADKIEEISSWAKKDKSQ